MYEKSRARIVPTCERTLFNYCPLQNWRAKLKEWENEPRERQLSLVNTYLNPFRYVSDPINWRMEDYWETPREFLKKFGDCEDYAIIKYLSLRELGWNVHDMRIVLLLHQNLMTNHAVLIVKFENRWLVLDNLVTRVNEVDRVHHYLPYISLNEKSWWRHIGKGPPILYRK